MSVKFGGGSGDYFTRTTDLPSTNTITVCGFANLTTDSNGYATLWGVDNGTTDYILLATASDGTTLLYFDTVLPLYFGASAVVGTPFFFGMTKSGSNVNLYTRQLDTAVMTTASGTGNANPVVTAMFVGNDGFVEPWNGQIWGLKIWSGAALTAAEVYQESCVIRPVRTANLYGWYPMLHSTVADCVTDFSGNGRNWTNTGSNTIGQGGPISWGAPVLMPSFAATSDVSVALTGTSITLSAGTLGLTHTQTLTGAAITSAAGTITSALAMALSGGSITSASGTVIPVKTVPLTGTAVTATAGTVTPGTALPLTGQAITSAAGTIVNALAVALTGTAITSAAGTITANVDGGVSVALTGAAITSAAGTLTPATSLALTGQASTASGGSLGITISVPLVGASATASPGTLVAALSAALTGGSVTLSAGTVIPGTSVALSGGSITFSAGTITAVGGSASATITIKAGSWFRYRIVN